MKNFKKKIVALGLGLATMASSVMSVSASAAGILPDAKPMAWGNNFFTPYTGSFYASPTVVQVTGMKWSADSIETIKNHHDQGTQYVTEYEFRPSIKTAPVWSSTKDLMSNLPKAYKELDEDDITIGCRNVIDCTTSTSYYGYLYTTAATNASNAVEKANYTFESEWGMVVPIISDYIKHDYYPIYYAQYPSSNNFYKNQSW